MYRCTIMPNGKFAQRWDVIIVLMLFFIATVTPFEVGFLSMKVDPLFYINRVVDAVFIMDIVLNFFLAYRDSSERGGGWVFDNRKIARHYLRRCEPPSGLPLFFFEALFFSRRVC